MSVITFKSSIRGILKHRGHSTINILGLSVGIACAVIVLLYVRYELSYDRYHEHYKTIYRIANRQPGNMYMGTEVVGIVPGTMKDALIQDIPEIEIASKFTTRPAIFEYKQVKIREKGFLFADPDFIRLFTFPVMSGDLEACLKEPFSLFVTEETAHRYFGQENPVGKVIKADNKYEYTVKGIIRDIPENSHFQFDFITGFESLYSIRGGKEKTDRWNNFSFSTYVKLRDGIDPMDAQNKLKSIVSTYLDDDMQDLKILLQPLSGIHLGEKINFAEGSQSDIKYLYLVSSMGLFILLIAVFNYINMASARAFSRGKEVGILKVNGARKVDLIFQYLSESVIHAIIALIISLFFIWLLLPGFNNYVQRDLSFSMIFSVSNILWVLFIALLTGTISGLYPAIQLARFNPVRLLRGAFDTYHGKRKRNYMRSSLVIAQYTIAVIAVIASVTVLHQLRFIQNKDLGFECDNVISVYVRDPDIVNRPDVMIEKLKADPSISEVTTSTNLPSRVTSSHTAYWEGKQEDEKLNIYRAGIDYNFMDFYGLNLIKGRSFSRDFATDTLNRYIINETAANLLGWDDPIGKRLDFNGGEDIGYVIGMMEDYHFHSLHLPVEPLAFNINRGPSDMTGSRHFSIKTTTHGLSEARKFVDDLIAQNSPDYLNSSSILSEQIRARYSDDARIGDILVFTTILAILLACLGLYGLSIYTTGSRTREMVIRRILGSNTGSVMILFAKEFLIWIAFALIVAWPLAFILMKNWLQNFSYHVNISIVSFLISILVALIMSVLSAGYLVIKTALRNPTELLRLE